MKWLFALPFMVFSLPAYASDVQITREACQWLTKHQPEQDVEYVEGVDVHGRAVVPAEQPSDNEIELPETIRIPLNVDLEAYLGISIPLSEPEANLGLISLGRDGLLFNGKPLPVSAQLLPSCLETALDE